MNTVGQSHKHPIVTNIRATVSIIILFFAVNPAVLFAGDKEVTSTHIKMSETALSISAFLEEDERLRMFTTALKLSDVWHHLKSSEATLFVTTNAALRTEGSAFLLEVVLLKKENAERLSNLMAYHFVPNENVSIAELSQRENLISKGEGCLPVNSAGGSIQIGPEAYVTETISAKNGSIYLIDRLLWRPYQDNPHCVSE